MDNQYLLFCLTGPLFYDYSTADGRAEDDFAIGTRPVPAGWRRQANRDWLMYTPDPPELPGQGWKIHVSGCLDNAERIIATVWDFCLPRLCSFKFLRSRQVLFLRNAKYAFRGGSGKLVTIYPIDEAGLELVCKELAGLLEGEPGPYILSDLRWGAGPLYVRYGGFDSRRCRSASGELVPAIEDDTGGLVPDERPPVFTVPSWVSLPTCLTPHLTSRNAVTVGDLRYRIEQAVHFSNGGGVYLGRDAQSGEQVILKEARPHAGLSFDGMDALQRLRREHATLLRLAGIDGVPAVHDLLSVGEHQFLVMEFIDGTSLNSERAMRHPGVHPAMDDAQAADYARWVLEVCGEVERLVAAIHDRGVVFGDLHPLNFLVRPDARAALVDYEAALDANTGGPQVMAAAGYQAPADRARGVAVDHYALACLRLDLFLPLAPLLGLDAAKAREFAAVIAERFPVPRAWLDDAAQTISGDTPTSSRRPAWPGADRDGWLRTRTMLARGILASATPERDDRLFPGDIAQFTTGGVNFAHGAAGVLYALAAVGAGRSPVHERWLLDHATQPAEDPRLGFYEGLHGVAYVLDHLGYRDRALEVVEGLLAERWEGLGTDLRDGLAGIGLNLAHLGEVTGEAALREAAVRAAEIVVDRLSDLDGVGEISGGEHPYAGLLRGAAGPALFLIRMFEATSDRGYLDHAATALRHDLHRCVTRDDGSVQVNEGWRTLPYLGTGSVGIGMVLSRYLAHRPDEQFRAANAAIRLAACSWFYVQSGLFNGRAGIVLYLSDCRWSAAPSPDPAIDADLAGQIRRLGWHVLAYGDGVAFPGEQLMRLSMDLATGTAGVLLALGAALYDQPVQLPFLGPPRPPAHVSSIPPSQVPAECERR